VRRPETRYARSGNVSIAYQSVSEGVRDLDLVYVPGFVSNIDLMWDEPGMRRFLERLAGFSRLILFDKRGTGLSDPVPAELLPTLEDRMDDVRAVMDAVGSERAALLGHSEGGNMSVLFAATYPNRTRALVLVGCYAKRTRSEDYPWAPATQERQRHIEDVEAAWGSLDMMPILAPSKVGTPPRGLGSAATGATRRPPGPRPRFCG
jgi:pimeloyl-ACP methyl ester carboxylesterase